MKRSSILYERKSLLALNFSFYQTNLLDWMLLRIDFSSPLVSVILISSCFNDYFDAFLVNQEEETSVRHFTNR